MKAGQVLSIIAAIITLVACYIFYWISYEYQEVYYINAIGFFKNIGDLFANPNSNALLTGLPLVFYYAFIVLFILLIASPILQLLGMKTRYGPLLGCIMPLLIGIMILLYALFGTLGLFMRALLMLGDMEPLVEDVFPFTIAIGGRSEYWGTYLLIAAGFFSLIAGLYDSFLIMGWLALVFTYSLMVVWEQEAPFIAMLLFAYSVATSPLLYMASKEPPDSEGTNLTMSIVVIGSILTVVLAFLGVPLVYPLIILCVLMLLRTFLLTALGVSIVSRRKTDYLHDTWMRSQEENDYGREIDSDNLYTEDNEEYDDDEDEEYDEDEYCFDNE